MNNNYTLEICQDECVLIDYVKSIYGSKHDDIMTFECFIQKIEDIFGNFGTCMNSDDNDELFLLNKNINIGNKIADYSTTLYQKNPFRKLFSFILPQYLNNSAVKELKNEKFEDIYIKESIEGITIILSYINNNWQIISEKTIGATDCVYRNRQINDLFTEFFGNKYNKLDTRLTYQLTLQHHMNNGILEYNHFGSGNIKLYVDYVFDRDTLYLNNTSSLFISNNLLFFASYMELINQINDISHDNIVNKKITHEGYNIIINKNNQIINYKIQTHIYQQLINIIANKSMEKNDTIIGNVNCCYLELYQNNKLKEYLPFFTNYYSDTTHRISMSVRTISKEFLDIYHYLKKNKRHDVYPLLPETYKKTLYSIHGIYIDTRKKDFINGIERDECRIDTKSISVHDIYHYLKSLPPKTLQQIYFDRHYIIKNRTVDSDIYDLFVKDCSFTIIQTKLMLI